MWSFEGRSSSLALFKHIGSESFDQKCNVNLIMRRVLLRIVLLQESAIDRHQECIAVWSYEVACSIWVDWLYYKWSFPIGLQLFFVICVITMGLLSANIWSPFLKIHSQTFLLKALKIRAWFTIGLADVCRQKLPTPGGTVSASPSLPSWLSMQLVKMGSGSLMGV